MTLYRFSIGAVDGIHSWIMMSDNMNNFREFYQRYGHEGDTVTLEVWSGFTVDTLQKTVEFHNEEAHMVIANAN